MAENARWDGFGVGEHLAAEWGRSGSGQQFDDMAPQKAAASKNGGGMGRSIMGSVVMGGHGKTLYAVCRVKWVGNHR